MKKWTALILFGVLLTSAGCGNAPADSAVQETKATTETTEEVVYTDPVTYAVYETLDALTADGKKLQVAQDDRDLVKKGKLKIIFQPGDTQYQPPQAVLDSWEFRQGIIDNTYYNYTFYDAEQGRTIFLEIGTTTHYNNMQERLDDLSQYSTIGQTIVQDEYWRIDYYPDNEDRTLYGIMPDSGTGYALMIWRDDGENGTQEELISVKDLLGL